MKGNTDGLVAMPFEFALKTVERNSVDAFENEGHRDTGMNSKGFENKVPCMFLRVESTEKK